MEVKKVFPVVTQMTAAITLVVQNHTRVLLLPLVPVMDW